LHGFNAILPSFNERKNHRKKGFCAQVRNEGPELNKLLQRFWNDEMGSAVMDWCILGAGAGSLVVAIVTSLA
jgi:hypothetical protein